MNRCYLGYVCLVAVVFSGCATSMASRAVNEYLKTHADISPSVQSCMKNGVACPGMNKEQIKVFAGEPLQSFHSDIDGVDREVWVYNYQECMSHGPYYYMTSCSQEKIYVYFSADTTVFKVEREWEWARREAKKKVEKYFSDWPDRKQYKNNVLNGQVAIGMGRKEVEMAIGSPDDINRSVGSWGTHEQWIYGRRYLYFENGFLTSWQD